MRNVQGVRVSISNTYSRRYHTHVEVVEVKEVDDGVVLERKQQGAKAQ